VSRAADLVRRMDRLGAGAQAQNGVSAQPAPQAARPRSGGGRRRRGSVDAAAVRLTVDLDPGMHRRLRLFALDQRTDASEIVRTLLQLLEDPVVRDLVQEGLE
jgi:hypothetical protein